MVDLQTIIEKFDDIVKHHILIMENNNKLLSENLKLMKTVDDLYKRIKKLEEKKC